MCNLETASPLDPNGILSQDQKEPLGITAEGFKKWKLILSPNEQCQTTEGNAKQ